MKWNTVLGILDRREGEDRRQTEATPTADRRKKERRKWPYGVVYKTTETITSLEDWLDQNASGNWYVALDDMDEALEKKSFKVMFSTAHDKTKFIEHFARNRSAA